MSIIQPYHVYPKIPQQLVSAERMVQNLWWSWNLDAIELIRRIDPKLWNESGRNPIRFFSMIPQKELEQIAKDDAFMENLREILERFEKQTAPIKEEIGMRPCGPVAYFSMEYGIHESIPLFAGGLGILAGDHLKAGSDRGQPLVAVGLLYRKGYFHQYLDQNGWQQEEYPETDIFTLPLERAKDANGNDLLIKITGPQGDIHIQVFRIMVGRIPLFLLDTNVRENPDHIRNITARLYDAEGQIRLAQEIVLGIGGMRALQAMGIFPYVCHLNEGHCSFVGVERTAQVMEKHGIDLKTALEIVPRTSVFTTHTPVAAGYDEFTPDQVRPYLAPFESRLGISANEIITWGQMDKHDPNAPFSMFVLGIRLSQYCNGVSRLHGRVARKMWAGIWPGRLEEEIPIKHITNGVHIPSWISIDNARLFERYLSPEWSLKLFERPEIIDRIDDIYDEELWRSHEMCRARLIRTCRNLMTRQYGRRNAPKKIMEGAASVLDHESLTIGFARRFATYKRAYLLLKDQKRLEAILNSKNCPVQIIFAGKAHPKDREGKEIIKSLIEFGRKESVRHRFIFIEDYDPYVARHLVQGCDVWLNNPRRPFEACGTSGIKAAANGVINVSILDGWWCEGYAPDRGWKIGDGEEYEDTNYQDEVESQALYNVLENEVIPCFYDRKFGDTPVRWIKMMKESMKMALSSFCAHKMVEQYAQNLYIPAAKRYHELIHNGSGEAFSLVERRERLEREWKNIRIDPPAQHSKGPFRVSDRIEISTNVFLGNISPDEVEVQACYGEIKTVDKLETLKVKKMDLNEDLGNGMYRYRTTLCCEKSGRFGLGARVIPSGDDYLRFTPGLITWA